MFRVEKENENENVEQNSRNDTEMTQKSFKETSDIKAQVLISGFSQKFGVSKFDNGVNEPGLKEKPLVESSFEEPVNWSE